VKTDDSRPIFRQIVDGIGLGIASGVLEPGDKLPSVRALAIQLSINPNTVAKAYSELTMRSMVDARQGLGLFVCGPKPVLSRMERKKRLGEALQRFLNDAVHLQLSDDEIVEAVSKSLRDFRSLGKVAGG